MNDSRLFIKRIFIVLISAFILFIRLAYAEEDAIEVYIDWNFPPYEYVDEDNNPTGFNVELLEEVAKIMNLDLEIKYGIWEDIREKLERGEIDMLTGMYYSEDRDEIVDFSNPHSFVNIGVFVRSDSGLEVRDINDLRGLSIIVQNEDIMEDLMRKENISNRIIEVPTHIEALKLLSVSDYDCAVVGTLQGFYYMDEFELENLTLASEIIEQQRYCFAFKEGDDELRAKINEGMRIAKETGVYRVLEEKWFGVYDSDIQRIKFFNYMKKIMAPAFAAFMLVLLWIVSLKRQVRVKTREIVDMNKNLEMKIMERTKDLQDALGNLKRTQKQLVEAEKLILLNDVAIGIAHEMNTPIGNCLTANSYYRINLERMIDRLDSNELKRGELREFFKENLEIERIMDGNLKKTAEIIRKFKETGSSLAGSQKILFNLRDKLLDPYKTIKRHYKEIPSEYEISCPDDIILDADPNIIIRIMSQLIQNSFMHGYDEWVGTLKINVEARLEDGKLMIKYVDNGKGISEDVSKKIFQPFFTTGREKGGTGLGLNIIYNTIINENLGIIRHSSTPYERTQFDFEIDYEKLKVNKLDKNGEML